ncbi:multidrug resistance efflux transporter family protein [Brevibacillus sp. GCM10020057]|uniref:DMT family transporter n=1 Tax=Brevibacillus sp. GCM10020057 TaxID=3317327 RepID=UPI003643DFFE
MRAIMLGVVASLFFATTFVLNRAMELSGGSWLYSASLRYLFMVPFLLAIVGLRRQLGPLWAEMKSRPWQWLVWSFVGFGLFYAPLCFAAIYSPGWLTAGTWQVTIIAGSLLVPLFGQKIPMKGLLLSLIILAGVALMQAHEASAVGLKEVLFGIVPIVLAAFAYPLGNRKMMALTQGRIDAYQRVLGMTLASLPFWLLLGVVAWVTEGPPSSSQTLQSLIVALSSGIVATVLFFQATDMAKGNAQQLAVVEATQAGEVVFAVALEVLFLGVPLPGIWSCAGMLLVIAGMVLHSNAAAVPEAKKQRKAS